MASIDEIKAALLKSSPAERHEAVVASGKYSIRKFFDNLKWVQGAADWTGWKAFLSAAYGLKMEENERDIYRAATGRDTLPSGKAREVWMVCGRRARKSAIAATIGAFTAAYIDHRPYLAPGERAQIPIIAKNKEDAKQIRDYIVAIFQSTPELSHLLEGSPTAEEIKLKTRCDFAIKAASLTAVRGKTVPLFIGDEIAFWKTDDSANPDFEIISSVKPAMLKYGSKGMVMGLSSPYAQRGILWDRYKQNFGVDSDILVWKAPTLMMHFTPEIEAEVMKAYVDDEVSAKAEYGAEFRSDVTAFVTEEMLRPLFLDYEAVEFEKGNHYVAFADPSGGSSDSFTLAVAHWDPEVPPNGATVVDYIYDRQAPFDTNEVVLEVAGVLKQYGLNKVYGDNYAGLVFQHLFRNIGISYHISKFKRTDLYQDLLPLINGKMCKFPNNAKLWKELLSLDRRALASGREIIDHPKGAHDDVANAVAGSVVMADKFRRKMEKEEVGPSSTLQLFLDKVWGREEPKSRFKNPYARTR